MKAADMVFDEPEEIGRDQVPAIGLPLNEGVELEFVLALVLAFELASSSAPDVVGVVLPPWFGDADGKANAHPVGAWERDVERCVRDGAIACNIADVALQLGQSTDELELVAKRIGAAPRRHDFGSEGVNRVDRIRKARWHGWCETAGARP